MRYIVASNGSYGDVLPFAAIADGLAARGLDVVFVSNARYRRAAPGARFVAADSEVALEAVLARCRVTRPGRALPILMRELVARPARAFFDAVSTEVVPDRTVVIAFPLAVGAKLACEQHGVPLLHGHLSPVSLRSVARPPRIASWGWSGWCPRGVVRTLYRVADRLFDRDLRGPLGELRADLGLPAIRRYWTWANECDGTLALFPSWFAAAAPDWPLPLEQTAFPLPVARGLAAPVEGAPPQVLATAGSPARGTRDHFRAVAEACAALELTGAIVSRYREEVPESLPDGVRWVPFAPFEEWLPRVDVVIHHGGAGTLARALAAGVPQLVMPWGVDQFDHAHRLVELGVARSLPFRRVTRARIVTLVEDLRNDASIRARCRATAARFDTDSMGSTCDVIERWGRASPADVRAKR